MVASVERIKSLSAEDLENLYFSILQEPNTFRALGLVKLHNARKNLEIIKPTEVVADSEKQEIEALKNKFEDLMVSDDFERVLYNLAADYENKIYELKALKLRIKNNKAGASSLVLLAYNLNKIMKIYSTRPLELCDMYLIKDLTQVEVDLARKLLSLREILPIGSFYFGDQNMDFLYSLGVKIEKYIGNHCERIMPIIMEVESFSHSEFDEGLEIAYSISQNAEIINHLKYRENLVKTTKYNIKERSANSLKKIQKNNLKNLKSRISTGKAVDKEVIFLKKLVLQVEQFIAKYSPVLYNAKLDVTQQQLDSISEQSYWEIQQLKASEENPEIISHYNRRLVELVDVGVKDATDFVLEIPKLQKMYIEKDYEGFFWTLNTITGIEFIGPDGINPNGNRVLESLKTQNFAAETESPEIDRKINLDIPTEIESTVGELKYSGNVESVAAANKFDEVVSEIEKAGGVSQFWFNAITNKDTLAHKIHHGRNKDGFNFVGCALISLGGPYRVVIERKSNRIIFVGNYHID